ncbi:MAG TPA: TolC family protein [Terriglobales bacterium]|nr:TolC family protein [Terriglobales bacterium]
MDVRADWRIFKRMVARTGNCRAHRVQPTFSRLPKLGFLVFAILLVFVVLPAQRSQAQAPDPKAQAAQPNAPDYSAAPKGFPNIFSAYKPARVAAADLNDTKALSEMIRDGKIELSLTQLAATVVENNLNLALDRYFNYSAQTDLLRAKSGQAARGVQAVGATIPDALFSSAIGAGVGGGGGAFGGIGGIGSISGASRSLSISPRGSFDPVVTFDFSWDRTASPLNTLVVAGSPAVTTNTAFYGLGWQQSFATGTSFGVDFASQRQSSTQQSLIYNPDVISRMAISVVQQMTNGFGREFNRRFQVVARNNMQFVREWYLQQVNTTLAQATDSYWDLVSAQEQVKATQQALQVAQQLYEDNKRQAEIGTLAPLDVVSAQAQVASTQRDLIVAQTNLQQQALALKILFSRRVTDALGNAEIVATDALPNPQEADIPPLAEAIAAAAKNRPEVPQAEAALMNNQVAVKATHNFLKPTFNVFGFFATAGLSGNQLIPVAGGLPMLVTGGLGQELNQFIHVKYPEYAFGFALTIPIKNRSALADNARASFLEQQSEISLQRTENQIGVEVRSASTKLMQAKAEAAAAAAAVEFGTQALNAEQKKRVAGLSTPYNVILAQRNLLDAELSEVQARATYAKALVEMERSMGVLLEKSHIDPEGAVQGHITQ